MPSHSIVEYFADHSGYKCGYCKNAATAFSQGMWAHSLNADDYQRLIDRGWRRSGQYCYKPTMQKTCCPQYAIRCHANTFRFSKSKKKVAKKMRHFLMNGGESDILNWKKRNESRQTSGADLSRDELPSLSPESCGDSIQMDTTVKTIIHRNVEAGSSNSKSLTDVKKVSSVTEKPAVVNCSSEKEVRKGVGADSSKPPCRKAKEIRTEKKLQKLKEKGVTGADAALLLSKSSDAKSLEAFLPHLTPDSNAKQTLEIRLVKVNSPEFEKTESVSLKLYQKYQCAIHNDTLDDCELQQWRRFLVDSPINVDNKGPGQGFGTFHNQYWLGKKLIAVGVLDILPNCLSSVYLYYDPDYGFLSLGVYSALSEIALVKKLQADLLSLEYYYMGYYIHSCPKMRYKGAYDPSELLCPETYLWVPISKCLPTLDKSAYSRLNVLNGGSPDLPDEEGQISSLNDVLCLFCRHIFSYGDYRQKKYGMSGAVKSQDNSDSSDFDDGQEENEKVREYVSFVGRTCATNMLLYRSSR